MSENFGALCPFELKDGHDYSLKKTLECNQFFRWRMLEDGWYTIVHRNNVCRVKQEGQILYLRMPTSGNTLILSEWTNFLGIFDDSDDDGESFKNIMQSTSFLRQAYDVAHGLHLLRQDPWECALGYLLSQNNNVARIKTCIEAVCETTHDLLDDGWYRWPTAEEIQVPSLAGCNLGYRDAYIYSLAHRVRRGFDLSALHADTCRRITALQQLLSLRGVGPKVASCIALFSLGHTDVWPEDVWIKRAMTEGNITLQDVLSYGGSAGLVQEYIYYYMTHRMK